MLFGYVPRRIRGQPVLLVSGWVCSCAVAVAVAVLLSGLCPSACSCLNPQESGVGLVRGGRAHGKVPRGVYWAICGSSTRTERLPGKLSFRTDRRMR